VIDHPVFVPEPWALRETKLDLGVLAQTESVFALSNGHIGLRGNLDEGEPAGLPGTYLNSFYEVTPLPSSEPAYGVPQAGQSVVNVTNGKIIRLLVYDEPFDVRYGELLRHERVLDLRDGVLRRSAEWRSPAGAVVQIRATRMVSFVQRAVAAISYEVMPIEAPLRVVLQSELIANEMLAQAVGDPRDGSGSAMTLRARLARSRDLGALLVHSTTTSGLLMATGMDHIVEGPSQIESSGESTPDEARVMVAARLERGECLRIIKLLGYGWSSERSELAIADQVRGAVLEARHTGWDGLLAAQRAYLEDFWDRADVQVEGDEEIQCAVRTSMFHCLQAAARAEQRAIPAKGLTGTGYDGHTFWDTESFVLQLLNYTAPHVARDSLCWRHATLDHARQRAGELGLAGAAFPWRTIRGLMAQRNLRASADVAERLHDRAAELAVDAEEIAAWREAADAMAIPYDAGLDVHPQAERFTEHGRWDFASTPPERYPLFLHYPYFDLYRKRVVKQADLVLAMHLRGDAFTDEQKARNFAYYEALTVRDSSLSACTQAVLAAEVGHLDLAYDYFGEAALIDLDDIEHNARDGLHLAALAGAWIVAVAGFGGMRDHDGELSFKPRLPQALTGLGFGLIFRGRELRVRFDRERATYTLASGEKLRISHHGEELTLTSTRPRTRTIPPTPALTAPTQPPGRAPARRGPHRNDSDTI